MATDCLVGSSYPVWPPSHFQSSWLSLFHVSGRLCCYLRNIFWGSIPLSCSCTHLSNGRLPASSIVLALTYQPLDWVSDLVLCIWNLYQILTQPVLPHLWQVYGPPSGYETQPLLWRKFCWKDEATFHTCMVSISLFFSTPLIHLHSVPNMASNPFQI